MAYQFNWSIFGHKNQLKFLQNIVNSGNLANTYLFYGSRGLGKKYTVNYFVQSIFCQDDKIRPCQKCHHCRLVKKNTFLDLYRLGKQGQSLSADELRYFLHKLSLSNVSGDRKIAIICGGENINLFAANALLKTLEEPPRQTTIILISDDINSLPATVISRCQLIKFKSLNTNDMEKWLKHFDFSEQEKETIINLSFGKPGRALKLMEDKLEKFKQSCDFIIKLLSGSTFYYMQTIDKRFDVLKKEYPNFKVYELGDLTKEYLDLFELFLRDLLWIKLDRPITNVLYVDQLKRIAPQFTKDDLLNNLLSLNEMRQKLKYNVSPQLLWENLFLNVK